MVLKRSKFNLLIPYDEGSFIIYNTLSGAIGKFNQDTVSKFNSDTFQEQFNETELELLLNKRILVPSDINENSVIDNDRANGITQSKSKHLRIWTTSACNARCYYCFENGIKSISMNEKTADDLINYIDGWLKEGDELRIEWFGGEPLLNVGIIDYIMETINPIMNGRGCKIRSSIISNGSLITGSIVRKMTSQWHIISTQITLDGYSDEYDRIKNYYSPEKNNFFRVVDNIHLLLDQGIHVAVRMNYDNQNYATLVRLIDFLHLEFRGYNNINYYLYPVWSSLNDAFLSTAEADNNLIKLFDMLVNYGMASVRKLARLNYRKHQCRACSEHSYNIFPDGSIGKCGEAFHQIIGHLPSGICDINTYKKWTDINLDLRCVNCVYLPICQGGCRSSKYTRMPQCFPNKNIFPEIVKWYVKRLEESETQVSSNN